MFAFTAQTWQGGDYIPRVWDAWLADPQGALVVGVDAADAPVALAKLSAAGAAEGWIEGIRVAPAARRQGWGQAITAELLERAEALGWGTVRFITERRNEAMHHVAAALGFGREGEYHPHHAEAGGDGAPRRAAPAEAAALWAGVLASEAPSLPLRWRRWTGAQAAEEWFAGAVGEGCVLVAADGRSVAVLAYEPDARDADLALLAATPAAVPELLAGARAWAAAAGAQGILALLPPAAAPAAAGQGWEPYTEVPMWLYQRDA